MSHLVQIVGGPRDGQWVEVGADVLVIPELSMLMEDWLEDFDLTRPTPTFTQVRYTVMPWHGKLCAVHPGVRKAAK